MCNQEKILNSCLSGDISSMELNEGTINDNDSYGRTALKCASVSGNLKTVKHLISLGANINDGSLRTAAFYCHLDIVMYLYEKGADIESRNTCGESALFSALINPSDNEDQAKIIEFLIKNGADIHLKNKFNVTPFKQLKATFNNLFKYYFSIEKNDIGGYPLLYLSVLFKDLPKINLLLNRDSDLINSVNEKINNKKSILDIAKGEFLELIEARL